MDGLAVIDQRTSAQCTTNWGTGVTSTGISNRERWVSERIREDPRAERNKTPFKEGSSVALVMASKQLMSCSYDMW